MYVEYIYEAKEGVPFVKIMPPPPFTLDGSQYDLSTYSGRFKNFLFIVDPRTLFTTDEELNDACALIEAFKAKENASAEKLGVTDADLWNAKRIKDAVVHPTTNEKIFPLFRMSSFAPMNVPIIAGMLNATSIPATLFWQWFNQSYNSAMNYANRSGGSLSTTELAQSYGIAVAASLGIALGLKKLAPPAIANNKFVVPYCAVAGAGSVNVLATRSQEITQGIPVFDRDGNELGTSRDAGKQAVFKTILSRSLGLPVPVLVIPAAAMALVPKSLPPRARMVTELCVITLSVTFALPACIAIFPQRLEVDAASLEETFHIHDKVYINKGL